MSVLLPRHVLPSVYDIRLVPDLEHCTFTGSETVSVSVHVATTQVVLHAHQLSVDEDATFKCGDGSVAKLKSASHDVAAQTLTLEFDRELPTGDGELRVSFQGKLNDELAGFYRTKYTLRGVTRNAAVTQFEATDARRCFPCWDEPALKAAFDITVVAPCDRTVISNMHATYVETSADGKTKTWRFARSPVMSTYLVAVVVGEFDSVAQVGTDGILTTVYTPVGKAHLGNFALATGVKALTYLSELFGHKYMGGMKCDHIAIPDFAAGAMENTGCITYREAALLVDDAQSSLAAKQVVAQVVAHELSHQWFGNLTTMAWWKQLWLNEGFAKHMEYVVTNKLFPEWKTFCHFTSKVQAAAFSLDSLASTHPIEVEVSHPDEINEIFDAISYNKGASVIRMMFDWLTHDVGFKGLHKYLEEHKFKNAETEDLWRSLAQVSGLPVSAVMRNWTAEPGFPYVAISTTDASGGALHRSSLQLDSRRFIAAWALNDNAWPQAADFATGPGIDAARAVEGAHALPGVAPMQHDWCIPISAVTGRASGELTAGKQGVLALDMAAAVPGVDGLTRAQRLDAMAGTLNEFAASSHAHWIKLNADHAAFFRTVYDSRLLSRLLDAVRTPADRTSCPLLGVNDRLGLVGDVAAAVRIGLTSTSDLLTLLWAMRFETDYNVWVAMADAVTDVHTVAAAVSDDAGDAVMRFMSHFFASIVEHVGWDAKASDDPNTPLLRTLVLRLACVAGDKAAVDEALRRFDAYVTSGVALTPDLKAVVYNTAASHGGAERWHALHKLFKAEESSEEQRRLLAALGRASDAALLQQAMDMVFKDEVRGQDAVFVFVAIASNTGEAGKRLVWKTLSERWDECHARYGGGNFLWSGVVGAATGYFSTRTDAEMVTSFFESHPAGSAARKVKQSLEAIRNRVWQADIERKNPSSVQSCVASLLATA